MEMDMPIPKGRGFTPFPFGQCQVCGAEATGNHYGANTCEGCKGFFKRSLPVFRTFRCFFGNKCEVTPETRNRCKACRFRKCVEAGMALDAVKMGRIPKAVKEHAMENTNNGKSGHQHRSTSRQISNVSQATSQNSHGTASSSPAAASPLDTASSPESNDYGRDDSSPIPGNGASNSGPMQISDFRLAAGARFNNMNPPSSTGPGGNKSSQSLASPTSSEHYRFHPYPYQSPRQERFKADRNNYLQSNTSDILLNGGSSGLLYSLSTGGADSSRKGQLSSSSSSHEGINGRQDRSGWQPTSPMQLPRSDYSTSVRRASADQTGAGKSPDSQLAQKPAVSMSFSGALSGGSLSHAASFGRDKGERHPDVKAPSAQVVAMADMAITGDFNENEPDMVASPDKMKAVMADSRTAVAVMDPSLRGASHQGMPVVPADVLVFNPSYVPEDKLPETAHSKLNMKKRRLILDGHGGAGSSNKLPVVPTVEDFHQISANSTRKSAMCEHTFHTVAVKNNEIYGEETRANELFLKESLSAGNVLKETEQSPQEMRDILKDRLITQVKRVVQLSESIPGFRSLDVGDQHSLLRTCILDVWMVHSARFLRDKQSYILFLETKTHYGRKWMEMFLTDEFLETVFQIAAKINSLDLSFDELALLKSILIVRPDRPGLQNVEFITILHNHLLDSLKLAISARRPLESGQLLDDFLELLKGWCILDVMQEKYVHPIDLSHFCQGPWKIGETAGVGSASVSSKTSERGGSLSSTPKLQDSNVGSQPLSMES